MAVNTKKYIEQYLCIRTKDARIVPLRLNAPQKKLYDALAAQAKAGKPLRAIVLKARQMGFSTLTEALIFKRTATRRAVRSGIVAHRDDSSNNLFNMSKRFYDNLPPALRPQCKTSNARELVFDTPGRPGGAGSAGRTIRHPVNNYLKSRLMSLVNKMTELFKCAKFGVHSLIVANSIITTEFAFAIHL